MRSPLGSIGYVYVDKAISEIEETNRDKAIHLLTKQTFMQLIADRDGGEFDKKAAANLLIAIAEERFTSLVPLGIKWSGQGTFYSSFGEDIPLEDNLFPFGTKLYKHWIERFSLVHRDLWAITGSHNRRFYVKYFANCDRDSSEDSVNRWLDSIQATLRELNALHSRLITQLQIIESSINLQVFKSSLVASGVFLFVLAISGYYLPVFLIEFYEVSWFTFFLLSFTSMALIGLIVRRLVASPKRQRDAQTHREMLLPSFLKFLSEVKPDLLRFKHDRVENIISMQQDLDLPVKFCKILRTFSEELKEYNLAASEYSKEIATLISDILHGFPSQPNNLGGFGVPIASFARDSYDFDAIKERILRDKNNFTLSHNEQHSTRDIYKVNLSEMSREQRKEFIEHLGTLRSQVRQLKSHRNVESCWLRLERSLSVLNERTKKLLASTC